ncbi:unnamed protein product [Paramecium primaurelia]|uniref:Uncharacterized protein n=1 Tax=Paramecium primaurelia TaxID=5886 RepID=A0A8S1JRM9_PARPR|nr:unnamed protein product [Paramecium primaurelia]
MNLNRKHEGFSSDDSVDMSDYKIESSNKQSTIRYSNSKSSSSDESLTDMIKKKRLQINKKVYGKEELQQQQELDDATFDLSDTYNDSNKFKIGNESTLESRIKKLEQELNTSVKSTLQRNYQHNQSASMTSVDSFSVDFKQFQQSDIKVNHYNNRLESLRSKNQEPAIEWKKGRKIEEFDFEISNLQQELESLKDSLNKEEKEQNKQKIKLKHQLKQYTQSNSEEDEQEYNERVYELPVQQNQLKNKKLTSNSKKSSHHSASDNQNQNQIQNTNFKKKSRTEVEIIDELPEQNSKDQYQEDNSNDSDSKNQIEEVHKQKHKSHASKKQGSLQNLPISAIEFKEKDGNDVSIDVVPSKLKSNSQLQQTENQFPNTLILPSKTSLQCDVSRLYKLNKEVEVLQQIEKIREKLKKSINKKMNTEKVIERYDPSFTMQSKSKIMNKSGKLHCPNCTYLLNKGMSTAYCHCNK